MVKTARAARKSTTRQQIRKDIHFVTDHYMRVIIQPDFLAARVLVVWVFQLDMEEKKK